MNRNVILLGAWMALTTTVGIVSSCGDEPTQPGPGLATSTGAGGAGGTANTGGAIEGVISASSNSSFETDPEIAVEGSGTDATVVVAWTGAQSVNGKSHVGYAISQDGGASWSAPAKIESAEDESFLAPDLVADSFGNLHMVFLGFYRNGMGADVYVATANGDSFGEPTKITNPDAIGYYDRPRATITNAGTIVVTYSEIVEGQPAIGLATSDDGEAWTTSVISDGGYRYPYPCADRQTMDGRLFLVALNGDQVVLLFSDDSGMTWQGGGNINDQSATLPPACSTREGELWVSYGVPAQKALQSVRVAHLLEDGTVDRQDTISDPEAGSSFYTHDISVEQDLAVNLVYYAGAGIGDEIATFRRVRYTEDDLPDPLEPPDPDAGPPGLPSEIVHQPVKFTINDKSQAWLGNNVGAVWRSGSVYVAYVDNAEQDAHVAFRKLEAN